MLNNKSKDPSRSRPDFWGLLWLFWDNDRIDRWKSEIFPDPQNPNTGVNGCFILICLRRDAHDMWNKGIFALKPLELSADKKQLTIQFFWQPQYDYQLGSHVDHPRNHYHQRAYARSKSKTKPRTNPSPYPIPWPLLRLISHLETFSQERSLLLQPMIPKANLYQAGNFWGCNGFCNE